MQLMPPVRDRGAARAQFGLSRSTANSISPVVGTRLARTNFSLFSVIWFPTTCMYAARADSRKLVLPKADGPELQRAVEATDIQRFHTIGVFRWPLRQISYTLRLPSPSFFACWGTAPRRRHSQNRPFSRSNRHAWLQGST